MLLENIYLRVIKQPTLNIFNGVSDQVTCNWHMEIFLNMPSRRRQNIPLLQHPTCSPATKILPSKFNSRAKWFLFLRIDIVEKRQFSFCPSVCSHASVHLPLDRLLWNFILEVYLKIIREDPNFMKTGKKCGTFCTKN